MTAAEKLIERWKDHSEKKYTNHITRDACRCGTCATCDAALLARMLEVWMKAKICTCRSVIRAHNRGCEARQALAKCEKIAEESNNETA